LKHIQLSVNGRRHAGKYVAIVDDMDFDYLNTHSWSALIVRNGSVYAYRKNHAGGKSVNVLMHREIYERSYGQPLSSDVFIDHIGQGEVNGLDNRRSNLRLATNSQNQCNGRIKRTNKSGFKGVHWRDDKKTFHAVIRLNGKPKHIGYFDSAISAAKAYDEAARRMFGEYARPNFEAVCR
jgi:hypothetical protein